MAGVGDNLASMLADKYTRANFPAVTSREEAPLEEAVALLVREKLTGRPVPKEAGNVVDLWREWIEDKAAADIDHLSATLEDQQGFARVVREMLAAMDMAEELSDQQQDDQQDENSEDQPEPEENNDGGAEEQEGGHVSPRGAADGGPWWFAGQGHV